VRAIGVSNFMREDLDNLLDATTVVPAVNQIEVHPYFAQRDVLAADAEHRILSQAWSPIGGITLYREGADGGGSTLDDPTIAGIAEAHGKTAAQVMLRWHLQEGRSAIPKSVTPRRIEENLDVFDFELTDAEVSAVDALDQAVRRGPEPASLTTPGRRIQDSGGLSPLVARHHSQRRLVRIRPGDGPDGARPEPVVLRVIGRVDVVRPLGFRGLEPHVPLDPGRADPPDAGGLGAPEPVVFRAVRGADVDRVADPDVPDDDVRAERSVGTRRGDLELARGSDAAQLFLCPASHDLSPAARVGVAAVESAQPGHPDERKRHTCR
jgi:hypothetical protein